MFSIRSIAATAAFSLIASSNAAYNVDSKGNVAMYWGQGSDQGRLSVYCDETTLDIIPIGFVNAFPAQGNGLPGDDYGNQCWAGTYSGPGYNGAAPVAGHDLLYKQCPTVQSDIGYCQSKGKKILLSLGGATGPYALDTAADGVFLAEYLWGAYGPYNATWEAIPGNIRPLDRGESNLDLSSRIDIDGFDFDIEKPSANGQGGYIACIDRLHTLFDNYKKINKCSKDYIISGAPQCPLPEANMGEMIAGAKFDILWIQHYNNDAYGCSALNFSTTPGGGNFNFAPGAVGTVQYSDWETTVAGGKSKDAKLYIGLLGGPSGSNGSPQDFLPPATAKSLIDAYQGTKNFGGIMLWEATSAAAVDMSIFPGYTSADTYWSAIKQILKPYAPLTTATSSICVSTTSSSSSSVQTSSSSSSSSLSSSVVTTSSSLSSSTSSSSSSASSTSSSSSSASSTSSSSSSSSTATSTSSVVPTSSSSSSSLVPSTSSSTSSSSTSSSSVSSSTSESSSSSSSSVTSTSSEVVSTTSSSSSSSSEVSTSSSVAPTSTSTSVSSTESSTSEVPSTTSSASSSESSSLSSSMTSSSEIITSTSSSSEVLTSSSSLSESSTSTSASESTSSTSESFSSSSTSLSSSESVSQTATETGTTSSVSSSESGSVTPTPSSSSIISLPPFTNSSYTLSTTSSLGGEVSPTSLYTYPEPTTTLYTTSTVLTTSVYTITSCAPTVTNCPLGSVTTEIKTLYTTVCPVTPSPSPTGYTFSSMAPAPTQYTTSTVYTTKIYTITSCAATVTDCPARLGSVTTEIIKLYTTVCPVSAGTETPLSSPAPVASPSGGGVKVVVGSSDILTTTKHSTTTLYKTMVYIKSTATVVPTSAPYPTGSSSSKPYGTASGLPSVSLVFAKVETSSAGGAASSKTPVPVPTTVFKGAACRVGGGLGFFVVALIGGAALLL